MYLLWDCSKITYDKPTLVQVMAKYHQQQAIIRANVDPYLWHHMVLLGLNELNLS